MQVVDRLVADEHRLDVVGLALGDAAHRHPHALLGQPAHGQQPLLERFELFLEMPNDSFHRDSRPSPRLPVAPAATRTAR